jgi:hypothetical protein
MTNVEKKKCPQCLNPLTGCSCGHRKADDGVMVHRNCLEKYNYILKTKEQEKKENDKKN